MGKYQLNVRVSDELRKRLEATAKKNGVSVSEVMRAILTYTLAKTPNLKISVTIDEGE